MTLEEELALIQKNKAATIATVPPVSPAPAPAAPSIDPTSLEVGPEDMLISDPVAAPDLAPDPGPDMPAFQTELPVMTQEDPAGVWDNISAGWTEDTITRNRRNYHETKRRDLALDMFSRLPEDAKQRVMDRRWDHANNWTSLEQMVIDEVARDIARDPARYGDIPLTAEDFDARIIAEEKAELEEAQATLERPGGLISKFFGAAGSTMASPTQAALMFAGAGAGSVLRIIATEAAIGGASEAVDLPDQYAAAARLDQPEPDALAQIGLGAVLGGGLAGAIVGATRLPAAARALQDRAATRRRVAIQSAPEGMAPHDAMLAVDAAEGALRGEQTVQEAIAAKPEAGTLGDVLAGGPGFSRVLEAGKGYTVVAGPNGQALRREGTRAWRNNNPGNIEYGPFARSQGAVGADGRFAVFPTYEAGRAAKAQLLWGSKGYRGMTIGQAINRYAPPFENNTTGYASTVARAAGASTSTPMAALTAPQRKLMLDAMERVEGFKPGRENGVQAPAPRAGVMPSEPGADVPSFSSSRGYTGAGQVTAGDGFKIDVEYEVVDLSSLFRATGDFQPRDRSRISSDAWIADTAARLDPAQLMPSPTADRGTPIVGPDGMIESGNGRYGAIERAYERHPDRATAYRAQIEAAGYAIPEGVSRPVLVARRKTELSNADLQRFTLEAQDSGVAAMTPSEVARASSRAMTAPVLGQLDPSAALTDAANGGFLRAALAGLPRSARNAMFDAGGLLNREGTRQLREALFARAWPDADILARFTETDPGEMKSLMEALETSAPAWAALRADIEAGAVVPDMDIGGHILDAMRLIAQARDIAKKGGPKTDNALAELLDEVDLLEGPVPPLTVAMVRKFWVNGRAAKAADVAGFLTRYANDARKAGASGALFDVPNPRDVLQAIDKQGFADLPEDIGAARGYRAAEPTEAQALPTDGFDQGATSPEAVEADATIRADLDAPPAPRLIDAQSMDVFEFDKLVDGLKRGQPYDDATALYAAAVKNHDALNDAAGQAASKLGIEFTPAPVKKLDRVVEKVTHKYAGNFRKIADVARTGITARTIDEADAFIAELAQRFDLIDEGWFVTPAGYFDRKLIVRFEDGQLGEIQIWPPGMLDAKSNGGHKLYEISRDPVQPQAARDAATAQMQTLYRGIADQLDPSFAEKLGFDAPRVANAAEASASESSTALSSPSTSSAISRDPASGTQVPLSDQILARPASDTAANSEASNLNSFMGESPFVEDTSNMGASAGDVKFADLRDGFGDVSIDMPDGTALTLREVLDDLDADAGFDAFIQACAITPTITPTGVAQ